MKDNIEEMYRKARKAFREVEFWPQGKVDEMVLAAAWQWQKEETRKELARTAVDESGGIGVYEDKVARSGQRPWAPCVTSEEPRPADWSERIRKRV